MSSYGRQCPRARCSSCHVVLYTSAYGRQCPRTRCSSCHVVLYTSAYGRQCPRTRCSSCHVVLYTSAYGRQWVIPVARVVTSCFTRQRTAVSGSYPLLELSRRAL